MRARVLFLGSEFHPLSVACLDALRLGGVDLVVGRESGDGLRRSLVRVWRRRGPRAVLRRALLVARARVRLIGRKLRLPLKGAASIDEVCRAHALPRLAADDPNGPEFVEEVRRREIDLIVIANYRRILRRRLFSAPPRGTINVHPSLLPKFRGPDPIYWMHSTGATAGGVTVHYVDDGIDTGPIIAQRAFPISRGDDERAVLLRAIAVARVLLPAVVAQLLCEAPVAALQDAAEATYFTAAPYGASAL